MNGRRGTHCRVNEDMHVHSTYSDGHATLEENVAAAERQGLNRICLVDHVRRASDWVPLFKAHIDRLKMTTQVMLLCGVEAKLLDASGTLDLPDSLPEVDIIYCADHQFPLEGRCVGPSVVRRMLAAGEIQETQVIETLCTAYCGAMRRYDRLAIAHPFSIFEKIGISDGWVEHPAIELVIRTALARAVPMEVDEKWRAPRFSLLQRLVNVGVEVLASSDAHNAEDVGRYEYVKECIRNLEWPR